MPKLQAVVTTRTEVELSVELRTKVKKQIGVYAQKVAAVDKAVGEVAEAKEKLETLFADGDAYEALEEGVRVKTPLGEIPLKIVKGESSSFDRKAFLKHHGLTEHDYQKFVKRKPKKAYLLVSLPKDESEDDDTDE